MPEQLVTYWNVGERWRMPSFKIDKDAKAFAAEVADQWDYNQNGALTWTVPKTNSTPSDFVNQDFLKFLAVKSDSLKIELIESAPVPNITVSPLTEGNEGEGTTLSDLENTIELTYGEQDSLKVAIDKFPHAKAEAYTVSVLKQRDLSTGKMEETQQHMRGHGRVLRICCARS